MSSRLQYPLALYIVWHPGFAQGKQIAENLYSIFCRDVKEPLARGLGIPVYFRSLPFDEEPIAVDTSTATRNAIVLLVDQHYMADDHFRAYTQKLLSLRSAATRLFPVKLAERAHEIGYGLESLQFIRAFYGDLAIAENLDRTQSIIKTELMHDCARLLLNLQPTWDDKDEDRAGSPVKLFLSHAKKDGLGMTAEFKAFIYEHLKLDVFFDTRDIADGYDFEKQIEVGIQNSALVVFHTDEYSSREWCRIEVLVAKKNKCPMVVVHDIKKGEKRSFPYMGNSPTITLLADKAESFRQVVDLTLYQVLNNRFQLELLNSFAKLFPMRGVEYVQITAPPELFNYLDIYKKKETVTGRLVVLYPEPPLGAEELKILNEIDKDIQFVTPVQLPALLK